MIELNTRHFHQHFIDDVNLSEGAQKLRNTLHGMVTKDSWTKFTFTFSDSGNFCNPTGIIRNKKLNDQETEKEIEDFFQNKLVFAVNTPNEEELNKVLKDEERRKYNLLDTDLQSSYILSQMNNWFKNENNVWLSAKEGEAILLANTEQKINSLRATGFSLDYQKALERILSFNLFVIKKMADKLKSFIDSSNQEKTLQIMHIISPSPKFTAVKVIESLKHQVISTSGFQRDDSFTVTSLSRLQKRNFEIVCKISRRTNSSATSGDRKRQRYSLSSCGIR